jgi:hypothetical protein
MQRLIPTAPRIRPTPVAALFLLHAALFVLITIAQPPPEREQAPVLQFVSLWPELPANAPLAKREAALEPTQSRRASPPPRTDQPNTNQSPAESNQSAEPTAMDSTPSRSIDWYAASASAAASAATAAGDSNSFSPAPITFAEPCKPRQFDAQTKQLMEERLPTPADPDPVGPSPTANCIVVGGRPMCVQKMTIRPRSGPGGEVFKDMQNGKAPDSSVPTPGVCD